MVKSKNKQRQINPLGGEMSVMSNPAKAKTVTQSKWFIATDADIANSEQVLSSGSSPYEVGSQITNHADDTSLADIGSEAVAWAQRFDSYTISEVEYYLILSMTDQDNQRTLPVTVWAFEDRDSPREVGANWSQTKDRQNLTRVVLRSNLPTVTLANIKPVPLFDGAVTDNSPSNVVPSNGKWIDSLATRQRFNGIRVFSACCAKDTSGQTYKYTLYLEKRVKITGRSML